MKESNEVSPPFYIEDIFIGTTFDDFQINQQKGRAEHRGSIPLTSRFSRNITLNLPVVSANMDTVTGPKMCIAMALEGGIGILPRSNAISIEQQVKWVKEVKRAKNLVIPNPFSILDTQTVGQTRAEMAKRKVRTLLVDDSKTGEWVGMITARGIDICQNDAESVSDWMEKRMGRGLIFSREDISSWQMAVDKFKMLDPAVTKIILIDKDCKTKGLVTRKDVGEWNRNPLANRDEKGRLRVGAAIGATGDYLERAAALIEAGADVVVMDMAHAYHEVTEKAVSNFRKKFGSFELVCGNVSNYEGANFLKELGVDGVKVGSGSGHGCQTRPATGTGAPQIHAVRSAWHALRGSDIPVISDAGVKMTGDIAKALAVGASSVMMGNFFAGTEETPGRVIRQAGKPLYKVYRGMTSPEAKMESLGDESDIENVEGESKEVPYAGRTKGVLSQIKQNLQSMISYAGEVTLHGAISKISVSPIGYLIPLTEAAQRESFKNRPQ